MRFLFLAVLLLGGCHSGPSESLRSEALPGAIAGVVIDAYSDEPIAQARVSLREGEASAVTDSDGRFVLAAVNPGTHRVIARAPGYLSGAHANVVVEADGETRITVRLFLESPSPEQQREWLGRDRGTTTAPPPTESTEPEARMDHQGEIGSITSALGGPALPTTIRVWRSQGTALAPSAANGFADRSCEGDVLVLDFEEYVKGVIPHEWIPSWHPEALRAGAIAARSFAASHTLGGGRWDCADVDDGTVTQVYRDDRAGPTDAAVDATRGLTVVRGGTVVRAEYSAENSHPTASSGIDDPVCAGSTLFGHGRGACQWGTQRWATATCFEEPCDFGVHGSEPKDHLWMMDHYFPGTDVCAHEPAQPCRALGPSGGIIDDAGGCFTTFGPPRFWRMEEAGHDGGLHWTNAFENDTPSNWARYEILLEEAGSYELAVHIVDEFADFDRARYELLHDGTTDTLIVDFASAGDGWLSLGEFDFSTGEQHLSLLDNYEGTVAPDGRLIADAIRLTRSGAPGVDAGTPDAAVDAATPGDDAAVDAGGEDAGPPGGDEGGCGCSLAGAPAPSPWWLLALLGLVLRRRKSPPRHVS